MIEPLNQIKLGYGVRELGWSPGREIVLCSWAKLLALMQTSAFT